MPRKPLYHIEQLGLLLVPEEKLELCASCRNGLRRRPLPAGNEDDLLYPGPCHLFDYELCEEGLIHDGEEALSERLFFVAGSMRVPNPPAGIMAFLTLCMFIAPRTFLMVSFSSRVSADFTTYASRDPTGEILLVFAVSQKG